MERAQEKNYGKVIPIDLINSPLLTDFLILESLESAG